MSSTFAPSQSRHIPRTRSSFSTLQRITQPWLLLCLVLLALAAPSRAWAQKLEPIPALSFSTTFGNGYGDHTIIRGTRGTLYSPGGEGSPQWWYVPSPRRSRSGVT